MTNSIDQKLLEDIKYGTNIVTGDEYLNTLMAIADVATEMVSKTLGPYGKTTLIDDGSFTYPTKDGWNVLKRLRFNDPIFNTLYRVLQQVSFDLVSKVGDGTTSSFIGATIFMHKISEFLEENPDIRQTDFTDILNSVVDEIIEKLNTDKYVHKIDPEGDFEDIYRIADIASNNNEELSRMIQDIYVQTGNPNIYVDFDKGYKLYSEIQTGYKLDCKPVNQKGYRNSDDGTFKLTERSMIAFFDHNVNYNEHEKIIAGLSRYASAHNCTVFVMAPFFDDILMNVIGTSINSMLQRNQVPNIMLIQVPLSHPIHREYLKDMVMLTNGQIFDYGKVRAFNVLAHNQTAAEEDKMEDALLDSDQYNFESPEQIISLCVGKINNITVAEKYIILQDYETIVNQQYYQNVLKDVKEEFIRLKDKVDKSTNTFQKEYMDAYQHYVKLYGKMGVIHVGGSSELEKHCLRDAVDDAVLACRSAYDNGYIRGLNLTMLSVIKDIAQNEESTKEKAEIRHVLFETYMDLSYKVMENKYFEDDDREVTLPDGSIQTMNNREIMSVAIKNHYGYDLVNDVLMTDDENTVINSTSTDIEILRGMVSILSIMLTSNQFLSINRNFDRVVGRQQQREEKLSMQRELTRATAAEVFRVYMESMKKLNKDPRDPFEALKKNC